MGKTKMCKAGASVAVFIAFFMLIVLPGTAGAAAPPASISISVGRAVQNLKVGESFKINFTFNPPNSDAELTWSSSKKSVAAVNSDGRVTAKKPGTTKISVKSSNGKKASLTIRVVKDIKVKSIKLNKTSASLLVGSRLTLKPTLSPSNATNKTVTYSTSNAKIATVASDGVVTAAGAGSVTITAKSSSSGKTAKCTIKVSGIPPTGIKMNTYAEVKIGGKVNLSPQVLPTNATDKRVQYTFSNNSIASIDKDGNIIGKSPGIVTVTVTTATGGKKAVASVTVLPGDTGLTLNESIVTLDINSTFMLTVISTDAAAKSAITFSSSNTNIATVDSSGAVRGVTSGEAVITARSGASYASCRVIVSGTVYRALLIGNMNYSPYGSNLVGPGNDLTAVAGILNQTKNGSGKDITFSSIVQRKDLKKDEIIAAIYSAFAGAKKDDVSYFFYSGHGHYENANNTSYICTVRQPNSLANWVSVHELEAALRTVEGTVVVIIDCCYSGGFINKSVQVTGRDTAQQEKLMTGQPFTDTACNAFAALKRDYLTGSKYKVLTASSKTEQSYEGAVSDDNGGYQQMGFFTNAMARATKPGIAGIRSGDINLDGNISLHEALIYTRNNNTEESTSQIYPANDQFPLFSF